MNELQVERLLNLLGEINVSLAQIARHTEPELPEEPNLQRPIEQFPTFAWDAIEATVVKADEFGPAIVEWSGRLWTRRSPENKFGEAIWFSRAAGKDETGANRYLRLITFRKVGDAEPLSRAAEKAVRLAATIPGTTVTRAVEPPRTDELNKDANAVFDALPGVSSTLSPTAPKEPAPVGPQISQGASAGPAATRPPCPNCGQSWERENPACRSHVAPRIQPPLSEPAVPVKTRQAALGTGAVGGEFRNWAKTFAQKYPKYRINAKSEEPDLYHLLMTVGSFGIERIERENLTDVLRRLEQHASATA